MRHCKRDFVNGTLLIWCTGLCGRLASVGHGEREHCPPYGIGELNQLTAFLTFQTVSEFSDSGSGGDLLLVISARRYWILVPVSRNSDGVLNHCDDWDRRWCGAWVAGAPPDLRPNDVRIVS